ncbi:MAG: glycosyltransferase family A protein [Candidatus Aquicultor sp.]|nr:glycosyltransferase family A protein [Candidatus Aquicultor sp.]
MAVYDIERTLADAIRSIFAQTFEDWELILIDDGSTDGSVDIARAKLAIAI